MYCYLLTYLLTTGEAIDRYEASRGLSATAELYLLWKHDHVIDVRNVLQLFIYIYFFRSEISETLRCIFMKSLHHGDVNIGLRRLLLLADFRDTAAVDEFYSLYPRRVVYQTFKFIHSYIMNFTTND